MSIKALAVFRIFAEYVCESGNDEGTEEIEGSQSKTYLSLLLSLWTINDSQISDLR